MLKYSHDTKATFLTIEIVKHRDLYKAGVLGINFIAVGNLETSKHDSFAINMFICDNGRGEQGWSKITGINRSSDQKINDGGKKQCMEDIGGSSRRSNMGEWKHLEL